MRSIVPAVIEKQEQLPDLLEEYSATNSFLYKREVIISGELRKLITSKLCPTESARQSANWSLSPYAKSQNNPDIAHRVWTGLSFFKPRPSYLIGAKHTFPGTGLIITQGLYSDYFPYSFEPEHGFGFFALRKREKSNLVIFGFETDAKEPINIAAHGLYRYLTGNTDSDSLSELRTGALNTEQAYRETVAAYEQRGKTIAITEGNKLITRDYLANFPKSAEELLALQESLKMQSYRETDETKYQEISKKQDELRKGIYHLGLKAPETLDEFKGYYYHGEDYWHDKMQYINESLARIHSDHQATIDQITTNGIFVHPEFIPTHQMGRPSY